MSIEHVEKEYVGKKCATFNGIMHVIFFLFHASGTVNKLFLLNMYELWEGHGEKSSPTTSYRRQFMLLLNVVVMLICLAVICLIMYKMMDMLVARYERVF